jgi:hypothetical protein
MALSKTKSRKLLKLNLLGASGRQWPNEFLRGKG